MTSNTDKIANNIIEFPKSHCGSAPRLPETNEEFARGLVKNKVDYANELVDHYAGQLVNKFGMHGFAIEGEQFMKDFAFTVETMRSNLFRSLGLQHPFHDMIDEATQAMMMTEEEEDGDDDDDETDPENHLL
jgi:hypothetical protein